MRVRNERRDERVELLSPSGTSRKSETQPFTQRARRSVRRRHHDVVGGSRTGSAGLFAVNRLKLTKTTFDAGLAADGHVVGTPRKSVPSTFVKTVPPAEDPRTGVTREGCCCENSEVLPTGSVAVAVIARAGPDRRPAASTSIDASPEPSVVTCGRRRGRSRPRGAPCGKADAGGVGVEVDDRRSSLGELWSLPWTRVVPPPCGPRCSTRLEDREVLEVVGPGVEVARVVRVDVGARIRIVQVDSQARRRGWRRSGCPVW